MGWWASQGLRQLLAGLEIIRTGGRQAASGNSSLNLIVPSNGDSHTQTQDRGARSSDNQSASPLKVLRINRSRLIFAGRGDLWIRKTLELYLYK